jgi:hypothetical protein
VLYGFYTRINSPKFGSKVNPDLGWNYLRCILVNLEAHKNIKYPSNFQNLPSALYNIVFAALLESANEQREQDQKKRMDEKKEYRWAERLQESSVRKFQEMSKAAGDRINDLAQMRAAQQKSITWKHYYRALAMVLGHHRVGHCGEYSALAVDHLITKQGVSYESVRLIAGTLNGGRDNHICVVVDAGLVKEVENPKSYSQTAIICDPWLDLVATPIEYFRVLEAIGCDFVPKNLRKLSDVVPGT